MRHAVLAAIAAGASVLAAPLAAADEPALALAPSTSWELNYADDSCVLKRVFGEGDHEVFLELRRFSPESLFQIAVMGKNLVRPGAALRYRFGPAGDWQENSVISYGQMADGSDGFIFSGWILPWDEEEEERKEATGAVDIQEALAVDRAFGASSELSFSGPFAEDFTLKTGPLLAAHRAMGACLDQMLVRWGVDAAAHKTLTRRAYPKDIRRLAMNIQREYSEAMLLRGKGALLRIRVGVDETGQVTDCHTQLDISEPAFERSACARVRSAPFVPALDKDGAPIASYWTSAIIYQLE